jgi:hypothetical protein
VWEESVVELDVPLARALEVTVLDEPLVLPAQRIVRRCSPELSPSLARRCRCCRAACREYSAR